MKRKDLTYLVLAVIILLVAGYLAYTQLLNNKTAKPASSGVSVEIVGTIPSDFNSDAQKLLLDNSRSVDYSVPASLTTGLGNSAVFGQ